MRFLKAKWNELILASYEVDPKILEPYVPLGTRLDKFDGKCYVSLVAFMFRDTKVLGIPFPGHVNFEEVNLRFYVVPESDPTLRSVVFIKEIVPLKMIELVANNLFNEHYDTKEMEHKFESSTYEYTWLESFGQQKISATINDELALPSEGSVEEFITEHYWGYTKSNNKTTVYEVRHEQWEACRVNEFSIEVDFGKVYGSEFSFLTKAVPDNVCFAHGSTIEVMSAKPLKT
jgi:uncharacterized protein YqjF (DUF2071 family)